MEILLVSFAIISAILFVASLPLIVLKIVGYKFPWVGKGTKDEPPPP